METKTAMMEHIQWLYEVIDNAKAQQMNEDIIQAIEYVIEGAKAKLPMEKDDIVEAFNEGALDGLQLGEEFYKITFKS